MGNLQNDTPSTTGLASALTKTFGQEGGSFNTWTTNPECGFNTVRLLDLAGKEMYAGADVKEHSIVNVLNTNLTPATTGVNATGIKSVYNTGTDITIVDSNSKRPRVLRVMFSLTFPLVKYSDEYEAEKDAGVFSTYGAGSTENVLKKNPDKIEFLKGTGAGAVSLFSIQLADGTSADEYDEESPYKDLSTNAQYV